MVVVFLLTYNYSNKNKYEELWRLKNVCIKRHVFFIYIVIFFLLHNYKHLFQEVCMLYVCTVCTPIVPEIVLKVWPHFHWCQFAAWTQLV